MQTCSVPSGLLFERAPPYRLRGLSALRRVSCRGRHQSRRLEHALSKGASAILMPVSCRRQLVDLSDDVATKGQVLFYSDTADALRKVLHEG